MEYNYNSRTEVPEKYRWDLTKYFKSDEEWYSVLKTAKTKCRDLEKYKGKLFEDNNLYEVLANYYQDNNFFSSLYYYAMLKQDENLGLDKYNKMVGEITKVFSTFEETTSYIVPEIIENPEFNIEKLIKKDTRLEKYRHILEKIDSEKKHTKDKDTEKIISILTKDLDHYENTSATMLNSAIEYGTITLENGEKVKLNTGNYRKLNSAENRDIRKKAYNKINKPRVQFAKVLGANLVSFMERNSSIAKVRGYNSTKEMFFMSNHIPIEVEESLVKNAEKNLPQLHEYYKVFKKILGEETLEIYDLNAPVYKNKKEYTIEDAEKYVYESTKILGPNYSEIIKKGFQERWVDYMPYKGKQSGGYCCSLYPKTSNILMSFNGIFDNISTLAHEMGHAANNYFKFRSNPVEYAYNDSILGEIASLSNEIYLANYVINGDFSKKEKVSVIIELLRTINSNFFGAAMEEKLEDVVYSKLDNNETVTSEDLNTIMAKECRKYYGKVVKQNRLMKYMWIPRSHYYMPYYLYKYATSICCAVHFATRIIKGDKNTLDSYLKFLNKGSDKYPNDILLELGIDLTKEDIYNELFIYYNELLEKLKELTEVGEIDE